MQSQEGGTYLAFDEEEIRNQQAFEAIGLLTRSADFHPDDPRVWIEIAQIYNNVLSDTLSAAEYFGRAARMENGPYFAGRLHAELLRRGGRPDAAYQFYREWYPSLPAADPFAVKPLVYQRIRELEQELEIPAAEQMAR